MPFEDYEDESASVEAVFSGNFEVVGNAITFVDTEGGADANKLVEVNSETGLRLYVDMGNPTMGATCEATAVGRLTGGSADLSFGDDNDATWRVKLDTKGALRNNLSIY